MPVSDVFESIVDPKLIFIYHFFLKITFIISCFLFFILVIFVFRKSNRIGNYKWFILFNGSAGFFFDIVIAFFEPIGIFPLAGIFVRLPFDLVEPKMCWVAIICIFASAAILTFGVTITLLYRYIIVLPKGEKFLQKWPYFVMGVLAFVLISFTGAFFVFHNAMTGDDVETQIDFVRNYAPQYESVIKTKMTIFTKLENVELFIKILGFIITGLMVALLILLFIMHFQIKKASTHLCERTNALHRMIFCSVLAEALTLIILLGIPLVIFLLSLAYKLPNGPQISIFVYIITSTHSIFFYIMIILTIKPYRDTIIRGYKILFGKQITKLIPGVANSSLNTSMSSFSHTQQKQQNEHSGRKYNSSF